MSEDEYENFVDLVDTPNTKIICVPTYPSD